MTAGLLAAFFSSGASDPGNVAVDDIAIDFKDISVRIPRLVAEGTPLTAREIAGVFKAGDVQSLDGRLARFSASSLSIPEIRIQFQSGGRETKLVYRDVSFENIVAGQAGAMRAAALDEVLSGAGGGPTEAHFSGIVVKNVDLRQIAHVALTPRTDQKETPKPLEAEASIESGSVIFPDADLSLRFGRVSAAGLRARALAEPPLRLMETPSTEQSDASVELGTATALTVVDALGSFEAGTLEARDLSLSGLSAPEKKPFRVTIGSAALTRLANGASEEGKIWNFSLDSADGGHVAFRYLAAQGLDLAKLLAPGERRLWMFKSAQIADLSADLPDSSTDGRMIFKIGAFETELGNFHEGLPTKVMARVDHFNLDIAARGAIPTTAQFIALGYKNIEMSGNLNADWRDQSQEAAIEAMRIVAKDMGSIELAATFGNVSGSVFSPSPFISRSAMLGMSFKSLEATLEGRDLIERLLAQEAKASGADVAKLRKAYARDAAAMISARLDNGDKARRLADAAGKFIEGAKKLRVKLIAPRGVGALEPLFKKPGDLLNQMEVEAVAE